MHKTLNSEQIIDTIDRLAQRVEERFPGRGIVSVACELAQVARDIRGEAAALGRPNWRLRISSIGILALGAVLFVVAIRELHFNALSSEAVTLVQVIEPAANIAILAALGILFLIRSEERWKQKRALTSLHSLRSMIHVVDMHQLTKDPSALLADFTPTASSPDRLMGRAELVRYLDYCSEMLSLIGKLAALHAQTMQDRVVVEAVNDLEGLSTNLSRKIWQKIMIIDHFQPEHLRIAG